MSAQRISHEEQQSVHVPTFREKLFGIRILSIFAGLLLLETLPLLLVEKFLRTDERSALWRLAAHRNCQIFLRLWKINVKALHTPQINFPVIYSSNHPSMIDGFVLFALLGPNVIALTAPFTSFAFPFNYWFAKMGFVDIQRDKDDVAKHPTANNKAQAFAKLFAHVEAGLSLLVFPEGHVERTQKLHYIHTGVARLSLQGKIPIQAMSLVGMENVFFGGLGARPGTLTVRFGRLLPPPSVSHYLPFRKVVKAFSRDIESAVVSLLPLRYLPAYYNAKDQNIAAFVDIDNTLYNGYSQKDFVRYLLRHKKISRWLPLKVIYWITLEKLHLLPHKQLMKLSLGVLGGFPVQQFHDLCQDFFEKEAVHKLNHHILPTLKDHKAKGHLIIIVSEVFHPLASLFKHHIEATASIDTQLEKSHGVYTGEVNLLNYGFTKGELVAEFADRFSIDLHRSYTYADSISDLPLLYAARYKTAVHPDKNLKQVALANNWPTL